MCLLAVRPWLVWSELTKVDLKKCVLLRKESQSKCNGVHFLAVMSEYAKFIFLDT